MPIPRTTSAARGRACSTPPPTLSSSCLVSAGCFAVALPSYDAQHVTRSARPFSDTPSSHPPGTNDSKDRSDNGVPNWENDGVTGQVRRRKRRRRASWGGHSPSSSRFAGRVYCGLRMDDSVHPRGAAVQARFLCHHPRAQVSRHTMGAGLPPYCCAARARTPSTFARRHVLSGGHAQPTHTLIRPPPSSAATSRVFMG